MTEVPLGLNERGLPLGTSIFDAYPFTVVSLDYVKSDRRRDEFARSCPKTIIVDEAHTCTTGGTGRHQRFALVKTLLADATRHAILCTATPHSGDESAFVRLLGLVDPTFLQLEGLAAFVQEPHDDLFAEFRRHCRDAKIDAAIVDLEQVLEHEQLSHLSRARLVVGLQPILTAVGAGWLLHEGVSRRQWLGLALGFVGAYHALLLGAMVARFGHHLALEWNLCEEYNLNFNFGPERLRAFNIPVTRVSQAIGMHNTDIGARVLEMGGREYMIRGLGYLRGIRDIENVAVGVTPNGTPIRVRDVAAVQVGPEPRRGAADWNGKGEVVAGIVVMRFGTDALKTIESVKARLEEIRAGLPPGVRIRTAYDRSDLIHRAIDTLRDKLVEESLIVAGVAILFLLHARLTVAFAPRRTPTPGSVPPSMAICSKSARPPSIWNRRP